MPDRSIARSLTATCPTCAAQFTAPLWQVIDAEARPDLMRRARAGTLQALRCTVCWAGGVLAPAAVTFFRQQSPIAIILAIPDDAAHDAIADVANAALELLREALGHAFRDDWIPQAMSSVLAWRLPAEIDEEWSDLPLDDQPDPLLSQILALLNAPSTAHAEDVVQKYPDLLDDSAQPLLHAMRERVAEDQAPRGQRARACIGLLLTARTHGLAAARFTTPLVEALDAHTRPELDDSRTAWMQVLVAGDGNRSIAATHAFIAQLDPQRDALLFAYAYRILGGELRRLPLADRRDALDDAIEAFTIALDACRTLNLELLVQTSAGLAQALQERISGDRGANYERAIAVCEAALAAAHDLPLEAEGRSVLLDALGSALLDRPLGDRIDNIERAIDACRESAALATDDEGRAIVLNNLARALTLRQRGTPNENLTEAIAAYEQALAFFERSDDTRADAALAAMNLGAALLERTPLDAADIDAAITHLTSANTHFSGQGPAREHLMAVSNLATAWARRLSGDRADNLARAAPLFDEAIAAATAQKADMDLAKARWNLATFLTTDARGTPVCDVPRAITMLELALQSYTVDADPVACRRAAARLGDLRLERDDRAGALAAFDRAATAAEALRQRAYVPSNQRAEIAINAEIFARCIALCAGGETADLRRRAFVYAEAGRARQFLDQVARAPLTPPADIPADAAREEARLLSIVRTSDIALSGAAATTLTAAGERAIAAEREAARDGLTTLWDAMAGASAAGTRYVQLRRGAQPSWEDIAALADALGSATAVISTFVLDDAISVCVMRAGWDSPVTHRCEIARMALHRDVLDVFAREVLGHVEFRAQHGTSTHTWQALGALLFEPLMSHLVGVTLLYVIPHAELHQLPLHALTVLGQPLIAHVRVVYAPSAAILQRLRTRESAAMAMTSSVVAAFAEADDPARDGIESEGRHVAALLGVAMLSGAHATRAALTAAAAQAPCIHLACHGFFDADDPLSSGLELRDGVMSARDWMALSLQAELVVLSACETGQVQASSGDELAGLMHALAFAGATTSLVTLWRVYSDAAMQWTIDFYRRLRGADGSAPTSAADAFQQATLALRASTDDVVAWAPFVLIGDAR